MLDWIIFVALGFRKVQKRVLVPPKRLVYARPNFDGGRPLRVILKFAAMATLVFLSSSAAQPAPQEATCLEETSLINVLSLDGRSVTGVDPSQLIGQYHGKRVRIISVTPDEHPRRVMILLDASGSMDSVHKFSFDVADELLERLPSGTQVGYIVFGAKMKASPILTADRQSIRKQLALLSADRQMRKEIRGATALFDAMQQAIEALGRPQEGDAFYVISDGEDNRSNLEWKKVRNQIITAHVRVFAMQIRWIGPDVPENLDDLVASTGGFSILVALKRLRYEEKDYDEPLRDRNGLPTRRAIEVALQARLITNANRLTVELAEPPRKFREWQLRFSEPALSKHAVLVYQHMLPPCTSTDGAGEETDKN